MLGWTDCFVPDTSARRAPPTRLQDCGWLLAEPVLGLQREAGVLLALCRELGTDLRLLERLAFARYGNRDGRSSASVEASVPTASLKTGPTRLHFAATKSDPTRIHQLIAAGADVDATDEYELTPLSIAVAMGRTAAARTLLAARASPGLFRQTYETYGHVLDEVDKVARHRLVLELAETKSVPDLNLLEAGLFWDLPDVVALSIDGGIVDFLHGASQGVYDNDNLINECSAACASILFPRLTRDYLREMMERCGDLGPEVHDLLRELVGFPMALGDLGVDDEYGANERSLALFAASGTGDLDLVKALLPMEGVQLFGGDDSPWDSCCSTTTHAAEWGHGAIVRFIVDNPPAMVDQVDLDMSLLACVMIGDLARVVALLRQGAEPWAAHECLRNAEKELSSCLRAACTLGNSEIVHVLLGAGAPIATAATTVPAWVPQWDRSRARWSELVCAIKRPDSPWWPKLKLPPAGPEDDVRRVDIIRVLVAAGADAAEVGLEHDPLYLRAFPQIDAG